MGALKEDTKTTISSQMSHFEIPTTTLSMRIIPKKCYIEVFVLFCLGCAIVLYCLLETSLETVEKRLQPIAFSLKASNNDERSLDYSPSSETYFPNEILLFLSSFTSSFYLYFCS